MKARGSNTSGNLSIVFLVSPCHQPQLSKGPPDTYFEGLKKLTKWKEKQSQPANFTTCSGLTKTRKLKIFRASEHSWKKFHGHKDLALIIVPLDNCCRWKIECFLLYKIFKGT